MVSRISPTLDFQFRSCSLRVGGCHFSPLFPISAFHNPPSYEQKNADCKRSDDDGDEDGRSYDDGLLLGVVLVGHHDSGSIRPLSWRCVVVVGDVPEAGVHDETYSG